MVCPIPQGKMENESKGTPTTQQENIPKGCCSIILMGKELKEFRTKQCPLYIKGTCPNSKLCNMSHSETWPRRNPVFFKYDYKLCPNIQFSRSDDKMRLLGKCSYGRKCRYSHSKEEQLYHPDLYKTRMCLNNPICAVYYCPFAHSEKELRVKRKSRPYHSRSSTKGKKKGRYSAGKKKESKTPENLNSEEQKQEEEASTQTFPLEATQPYVISCKRKPGKPCDLESASSDCNVGSPTLMTTQEVLGIADIGLTTLGDTVILQDDADDYMEYFNRYISHISGSSSASAELAISLSSNTDYNRLLLFAGVHHGMYSLEDVDEDEWFEGVIRAGLEHLREELTQQHEYEHTSAFSVCSICQASSEFCIIHNRLLGSGSN